MDVLDVIGRSKELITDDITANERKLSDCVKSSNFLVLGGAGTIGQSVVKEIFKRSPKKLHVVDISENNLVELVRDIRSTHGYISGDFQTFALDIGSVEYDAFIDSDGCYDYVLNLSALKHVRSESDPFTLMRMVEVNIFNTEKTIKQSIDNGVKKYFCVSTDKAANPVNMMGCSKRIMELFLLKWSKKINISTARFANVAFSDGSLLHGFKQRIEKKQPIAAPADIKRYFVSKKEAGEICLMSTIFGDNGEVYFPKLDEHNHLVNLSVVAKKFLSQLGYTPLECFSEEEARLEMDRFDINKKLWPCIFTQSDTTGEKGYEEFYTSSETIDFDKHISLGVIKLNYSYDNEILQKFTDEIIRLKKEKCWSKADLVFLFSQCVPSFAHKETFKYLDSKM